MSETAVETQRARRTEQRTRRQLPASLLKGLHAEWRKLSPGLSSELPEREARLAWTNEQLCAWHRSQGGRWVTIDGRRVLVTDTPPIQSWSALTQGQAMYLLKRMREESGSAPDYRGMLIARLAEDLFGAEWDAMLAERLHVRFQIKDSLRLTPAQAHAEIEELMSRIARRDGIEIEAVRAKFTTKAQRHQA